MLQAWLTGFEVKSIEYLAGHQVLSASICIPSIMPRHVPKNETTQSTIFYNKVYFEKQDKLVKISLI